jgi:hypothetical protein
MSGPTAHLMTAIRSRQSLLGLERIIMAYKNKQDLYANQIQRWMKNISPTELQPHCLTCCIDF